MKKLGLLLLACSMLLGTVIDAQALTRKEIENAHDTYGAPLLELYEKQNYKQVIEEAKKLTQHENEQARYIGWSYLADTYTELGEKEKALNALEETLKFDKEGLVLPLTTSSILLRLGEEKRALRDCLRGARNYGVEDRDVFEAYCRNKVANFNGVTAAQLWSAFNDNEVAAEDRYKGRLVAVTGKISKIATSITGAPEVTMNVDQYGMATVTFDFPRDARAQIAKLKKGSVAKISGECKGFLLGMTVHFSDCWIPE